MKPSDLSAKAELSRIALFSAFIGAFLLATAGARAVVNELLSTHYQRAITTLAAIEDLDASVKDMLIASKGLLIDPANQAEWDESRRASVQFRRSMVLALRHSDNVGITEALKRTEAEFDGIIKTTGQRLKNLLKSSDPGRIPFYYQAQYPRVHILSERLLQTKEKAFEDAHKWFHMKETLGRWVEGIDLLVLILAIGLLIYRTRSISRRLSAALEGISLAMISCAHSIGGVSRKMDSTSQALEGASMQQASLVKSVLSIMGIVTAAAESNATEADFGLARSAESWFVSFSVRQNVDLLVAAMRELQLGSEKLRSVMGEVEALHAAGGDPRLDSILAGLNEVVGKLGQHAGAGETLSSACVESFDGLNVTLKEITDSVRAIEALSRTQRDEIINVDRAITHISDGTQQTAEASRLVVDEASVLKAETLKLLDSVERLKVISIGDDEDRTRLAA